MRKLWPRELSCQHNAAACLVSHGCAGGRLHQQPARELEQLRAQPEAHVPSLPIPAGQGTPLPDVSGPSLDVSFCLRQGQSSRAGLLLRPWLRADSTDAAPTAAALVVDWHAKSLQVISNVRLEQTALWPTRHPSFRSLTRKLQQRGNLSHFKCWPTLQQCFRLLASKACEKYYEEQICSGLLLNIA